MLTSEPGALDITGLEPRNPFALALRLSSLYLHACIHGCWSADFLIYLEFARALVTNSSNIYRIYVDVDQVLTFVAEPHRQSTMRSCCNRRCRQEQEAQELIDLGRSESEVHVPVPRAPRYDADGYPLTPNCRNRRPLTYDLQQ